MLDVLLVERAANCDMEAFGSIYNILYPQAMKFLLSMSVNQDNAEQVIQDTFIEFLKDDCRAIKNLRDYSSFEPYFFRSLKNRYFNLFHRENKRTKNDERRDISIDELYDVKEDGALDDFFGAAHSVSPEEIAEREEIKDILLAMIDELPTTQKEAFNLSIIGDMKYSEIAQAMDVPENTVKSYILYAKKKLRTKIEEYEKKSGVKLHSVIPILPFLRLMYGQENVAVPSLETLLSAAEASAATASTAAAGSSGASAAASTGVSLGGAAASVSSVAVGAAKVGAGIATKVIAGIVAAAVVGTTAIMLPTVFHAGDGNEIGASVANKNVIPENAEFLDERLMPATIYECDASLSADVIETVDKKYQEYLALSNETFILESKEPFGGTGYMESYAGENRITKRIYYNENGVIDEITISKPNFANGTFENFEYRNPEDLKDHQAKFTYYVNYDNRYCKRVDDSYEYNQEGLEVPKVFRSENTRDVTYHYDKEGKVIDINDNVCVWFEGGNWSFNAFYISGGDANTAVLRNISLFQHVYDEGGEKLAEYDGNCMLVEGDNSKALLLLASGAAESVDDRQIISFIGQPVSELYATYGDYTDTDFLDGSQYVLFENADCIFYISDFRYEGNNLTVRDEQIVTGADSGVTGVVLYPGFAIGDSLDTVEAALGERIELHSNESGWMYNGEYTQDAFAQAGNISIIMGFDDNVLVRERIIQKD